MSEKKGPLEVTSAKLYRAAQHAIESAVEAPYLPALQRDALVMCARLLTMAERLERRP